MRLTFTLGAPVALLALLAGCATPRQQCLRQAAGDLPTINRLIAETQANLARGYGYERRTVVRHEWRPCDHWGGYGHRRYYGPRMCFEPVYDSVRKPVAIDPLVEQRKLDGLMSQRKTILARAEPALAACNAQYPEGKP